MYNDQIQKLRRRELRKNQTEAEKLLWNKIRNRQLNNFKFYRQYSAGPYILDFFCPEIRLAIELDGEEHKDRREYDKERENFERFVYDEVRTKHTFEKYFFDVMGDLLEAYK